MKAEGLVKQEHILDAAIKRFSYFGVNKTTLTEIADDLSISKPSLFYYFHDKNSLIEAVAEKIINECLQSFETTLDSSDSVEEGLLSFIEVKREYFKKYFLLAIQGNNNLDVSNVSSSLTEIYLKAREKTEALISSLLDKGIEQEVFKPTDTKRTSVLLLDTLSAFEYCMKGRKTIPEVKDINEMFDKQKEVLQMFLNGLKNCC